MVVGREGGPPDLEALEKCILTRGGVWAPIRQAVWVGLGAPQGSATPKG